MRPHLVDFFCGGGGCTRGYQLAGFRVTGVDLVASPNYCGDDFIQADALELMADPEFMARFSAAHASPPCQAHTTMTESIPPAYCEWIGSQLIAQLPLALCPDVPSPPKPKG